MKLPIAYLLTIIMLFCSCEQNKITGEWHIYEIITKDSTITLSLSDTTKVIITDSVIEPFIPHLSKQMFQWRIENDSIIVSCLVGCDTTKFGLEFPSKGKMIWKRRETTGQSQIKFQRP